MKPNIAHLVMSTGDLDRAHWAIVYAPTTSLAMDVMEAQSPQPFTPGSAMGFDNPNAPRHLNHLKKSTFHGAFTYDRPAYYIDDCDVRRNDGTPTGLLFAECTSLEGAKVVLQALLAHKP
jgi:hypothetical protein